MAGSRLKPLVSSPDERRSSKTSFGKRPNLKINTGNTLQRTASKEEYDRSAETLDLKHSSAVRTKIFDEDSVPSERISLALPPLDRVAGLESPSEEIKNAQHKAKLVQRYKLES